MNQGFKHRLSIEAGDIGAWERNLLTHVISISPILARIMGLPAECLELTAAEWQAMVIPEDRPLLAGPALEQALLSDQPFDLEFRLIRPDGQMISLISRGCFVRDEQGKPTKAVGVCFLNKSSNDVLKSIVVPTPPPPIAARPSTRLLTKQQREVLRHAVEGKNVKETALALSISETTVRQHQRDARNRLGARTLMHAASLVLRAQLI